MKTIVQLEPGVWLREGEGDPCRTLVRENATAYLNMKRAGNALLAARTYRSFLAAEVQAAEAKDE